MVAVAPGINPPQQRTNACKAASMKQQRDASARDFIRARTIDDYVPIVWKLMTTRLEFVHNDVDGSLNDRRVLFQFGLGAQIENDRGFAGVQFLTEFCHSDPRH